MSSSDISEKLIPLSELMKESNGSKSFNYKGLYTFFADECYNITIAGDKGYIPVLKCRDALIDEFGFTLEGEYGLTDMFQGYSYKGFTYVVKFISDADAVFFALKTEGDKLPECFFDIALRLIEICE